MTLKEAKQIYYIKLEIKRIEKDLQEMDANISYYKPINLEGKGMPRGSPGGYNMYDKYLDKQQKLKKLLAAKLMKLNQKQTAFERFLSTVDDPETRLILRLRCLDNLTWEEIGNEIGYHRTSVSGKFYAFFDQQ